MVTYPARRATVTVQRGHLSEQEDVRKTKVICTLPYRPKNRPFFVFLLIYQSNYNYLHIFMSSCTIDSSN